MSVQRKDDTFLKDHNHLKGLTDQEIDERFWQLTEKIVDPLLKLARENTTPSIERSVLIRLGFSSIEAMALVEKVMDYGLMSKGAGHIVYVVSKENNISIKEAGLQLLDNKHWDEVVNYFKGE